MKSQTAVFIITKQITAKDFKDALKREQDARLIGIVLKNEPPPEQLEPALGTPINPRPDDETDQLGFHPPTKRRRK
jgi:hypothetical protein